VKTRMNTALTRGRLLRNGSHYDDSQNRIAELRRRLAKADSLIATYQGYKDA